MVQVVSPSGWRFLHILNPSRIPLSLVLLACTLGLTACTRRNEVRELRKREAASARADTEADSVDKAMQYLPYLMRLDRGPVLKEFINQMNAWAIEQKEPAGWRLTSRVDRIPAPLRTSDFGQRLERVEFGDLESEYLWQCRVMRNAATWIVERPYRDPLFRDWLEAQRSQLDPPSFLQLEESLKLFDWTVRNVAMEGSAKDIEALPRNPAWPLNDQALGYRALPWQTMMFGRGDAIQRGRVFTQLLFQRNIPSLMLALPSPDRDAQPSEHELWCIGVPIGKEIYLFEHRLGMPLPLADQAAVATLRDAKTDPAVLRRAKLPGRFEYPMTIDRVKESIALVDVEPFAIGQTMRALEGRLSGDDRLTLTWDVDRLAEQLKTIDPQLELELWSLPWLAQLYNRDVRARIDDLSPFSQKYQAEYGAYLTYSIVSEARLAHFRGEFETSAVKVGAPKLYMDIRVDEATLDQLTYDTNTQKMLQVERRFNESQEEYQFRIRIAQEFYRSAKLDSNAFLGMLQFDLDNVDAAKNWLEQRLLKLPGADRWQAHAQYLLGRYCEEKGERQKALEWYKTEGVPQEAGNRIRGRLMEQSSP